MNGDLSDLKCSKCGSADTTWVIDNQVLCYTCAANGVVSQDILETRARKAFVPKSFNNGKDVKATLHKYGAVKTDGYPSKAQARRAAELKLMEKAGDICNLQEEVPFDIVVNGVKVCKYVADFVYDDPDFQTRRVVEDVKGMKTPVYRLKKKLMLAVHGIEIKETT